MKNEAKKDEIPKEEESKDSSKDSQAPMKPLLSKSAILKLLAELVKSYAGVAQLITDYNHTAKLSSASEVSYDCVACCERSCGVQGWRSGETTRLPPMWPGIRFPDSAPYVR